jgi:hypothetical protein
VQRVHGPAGCRDRDERERREAKEIARDAQHLAANFVARIYWFLE